MNSVNYIKLGISIFMAIFLADLSAMYVQEKSIDIVAQTKMAPVMHHQPIDFVKLEQERWEKLEENHKI
jgi:hypothetical protein